MCDCNGQGAENDTGKVDLQQIILDELHAIRGDLDHIKDRIEKLEETVGDLGEKMGQVVTDLNVIHTFQQGYNDRLQVVEKLSSRIPLRSTPLPRKAVSDKGEDGKLKP